ncbi:hypothetical protein Tco_1548625 [Tanacetum coccineum]
MANVNHDDEVPVVEPNQHNDVPVVPEPILEDEDGDPEEEEFKEEEDPQKEEEDIEVDIKEDENEPELTYPYKETDSLNPPSPASESELDNEIEVENLIEHENETVLVSVYEVVESSTAAIPRKDGDRLLSGFMRWDIDSLFGRMVDFSRRLCCRETAYALVEKKSKANDKFYGKLILDLGNEVRSRMDQGMAAMERLVEKLSNVKEKAEYKKVNKELEEAKIMPLNSAPMTQAAMRIMIKESVDAAIAVERERKAKVKNDASGSGLMRGAIELRRWFEKTKSVFGISECAEGKKVRFVAATLEGPALTWWNSKFCPLEEIQHLENELWNLKVKESDIVSYTQRFNELAVTTVFLRKEFELLVAAHSAMPRNYRIGVVKIEGPKNYYSWRFGIHVSRSSFKVKVPMNMYPCKIVEKVSFDCIDGKIWDKLETVVTKDGKTTVYPWKLKQLTKEEEEEEK